MKTRIVPILFALAVSLTPAVGYCQDSSKEALAWLQKMSNAIKGENYQGTFTFIRGRTFDTVQIVHQVVDGKERERLFNLNGDVRELYREGDEIICLHPKEDSASGESISDHSVQIGPFTTAFPERVLSSENLYRFSMLGDDRIAGRSAVKLAISPRHSDRYGYVLWLDRDSGLLLQSHLVDRGKLKEIFQFTEIEIGIPISDQMIASSIVGETRSHNLKLDTTDHSEKPAFKVAWLPDGFRPVRMRGNRLHFTDGLANFSVFIEKPNVAGLPDLTTTVGGTVVITRKLQTGSQITVVGEVPVQTARKVADSVEPVIY